MRIGIDARFYGPQGSGLSRYVDRLLTYIEPLDQENEYIIFLRPGAERNLKNRRWSIHLLPQRWYTVREQLELPRIYQRLNLDLLHVPHFNIPVFYTGRLVVTIHDLILSQHASKKSSRLPALIFRAKHLAYRFAVVTALRRARRVIAVSNWSREQIIKNFPSTAPKIRVTYEAADELPQLSGDHHLTNRGVHSPYLLYVGNAYPYKNLNRLVEAWKTARRRLRSGTLVIVGPEDFHTARLRDHIKSIGAEDVLMFGYASDAQLRALYSGAQAVVMPSLSEGFGLPGLEAMTLGIPVVASRATCLPEIYGQAADYFDPYSVSQMSDVIQRIFTDALHHQALAARGRIQAAKYSWNRMARETLAVYQEAVRS